MNNYNSVRRDDAKLARAALVSCYPFGLENIEGEEWRDVVGYESLYQVSNYGRVKSFFKNHLKILCPVTDITGYLSVTLCKEHIHTKIPVHRIVAMAFIPNPDNKSTVNHIDGCKMNNYVDNLEWTTRTENNRHAAKIGLMKSGADCKDAKLTKEQVRWCRSVHISGDLEYGTNALARKFGVSSSLMYLLLKNKVYKDDE